MGCFPKTNHLPLLESGPNESTSVGLKFSSLSLLRPVVARPVHGELPLAQFAGFGVQYTTAGMHDFPYKQIFHRETANRSRTSVTFLFLANARRLLHFRISLDCEKLRVFGLYAVQLFYQFLLAAMVKLLEQFSYKLLILFLRGEIAAATQ